MKGISDVIAVTMILMITVALASLGYIFFVGTFSSVTNISQQSVNQTSAGLGTNFKIESISGNRIYIRNIGSTDLTNIAVYVDGVPVNFAISDSSIKPGAIGYVYLTAPNVQGSQVTVTTSSGLSVSQSLPTITNLGACSDTSAVLCLKFDEGLGYISIDSSPANNNATLGTNILSNPSFESGLWQTGTYWTWDTIAYNGSRSAKLANSPSYCNDYQRQDLPILPNKRYSISARIKTIEPNSGFYATVGIANTTWYNFVLSPVKITGTTDWTWVNLTGYDSNQPNNGNLRFFVTEQHCSPPNTGQVWFDDVYAGYNIPIWVNGKYGKALLFDGVDDYVSVTPQGSVSGQFTVVAWVNVADTSARAIVGTRSPTDYSFDFKLQNGNIIHGDIGNGASWITTSADASFTYSLNTWYQIVYVVNTTSYTIYVNGQQVGSGTYAANTPLLFDSNHQIKIGQFGGGGEFFNGMIDEVRIFNRALSPSEVATLY